MIRHLVRRLGPLFATVLVGLAGCELLKHNEETLAVINKRVIGMPAGEFFDRYGRGKPRVELSGGGTVYDWTSDVRFALPGPQGLDERICKLRVTADKQGRISAVEVLFDAPGQKSTSRCGELFAA